MSLVPSSQQKVEPIASDPAAIPWLLSVCDQVKYSEPNPSARLASRRRSGSRPVKLNEWKKARVPNSQNSVTVSRVIR